MMRARGVRVALAAMLVVLTALVAVTQPAATLAQTTVGQPTSSQTVGTATVSYSDVWTFDPQTADPSFVMLTHRDILSTVFMHGEIPDPTVTDANSALDQVAAEFLTEFDPQSHQVLASDVIDQTTFWRLYSMSANGIPFGMLVTADITVIPGTAVLSMLIAPEGSLDLAVTAVKEGIDINGAGSPFSSFNADELAGIIEGGGQAGVPTETATSTGGLTLPPIGSTTTPETGTTPNTGGDLTLPPIGSTATAESQTTPPTTTGTTGQTQAVQVNTAAVSYGPPWVYDEATSTPNEVAFFGSDSSETVLFGYAYTADATGDAGLTLDRFNEGFFGSFGATDVQKVSREILPSGHAYSLYTAVQSGIPVVVLAYADVTTAPGEFRVQLLVTEASEFDGQLAQAMQAIQVDGVGVFSQLDPSALSTLLAGGSTTGPASTTTPVTSTTQTGGSTLTVTGDVSQFEAQDTQGTCDVIGWAVTSPDQAPASEADINYRSACVGSNVFFATCGTVPASAAGAPEAGMAWVQCDVTVRVDGSPLELTMFDFELTDAAGTAYMFDILAGIMSIQTIQLFPETAVATGQTVTGSVIYSVPVDAPGPWVLNVNPLALAETGTQPGSIVISGDLQPVPGVAP